MIASLISPKTNKLLLGSIIPHLPVTHTKKGSARQHRTGSWPELSQMICTGQDDTEKGMTHLEIKLL